VNKREVCKVLDKALGKEPLTPKEFDLLCTLKARIERGVEHRGFGARQRRPTLIIDWSDEGGAG